MGPFIIICTILIGSEWSSFRRKPESSYIKVFQLVWIPVSTGVIVFGNINYFCKLAQGL